VQQQFKTKHKHMKTILLTIITATVAVGNTLPPTWDLVPKEHASWELTTVDNTLPPTWELVPNSGDFDIRTING
jgi:hypothetical protein